MRWISWFTIFSIALPCWAPAAASTSNLVHIFGDSILADNTPIQSDLQKNAPAARFENFAKIGAGMQDGWVESIPSIYNSRRTPVPDVVILDGGGNDVNSVRQECLAFSGTCKQTIDNVLEKVENLLGDMRDDGVRDIVYVGFYYITGFEAAVDYGNSRVSEICRAAQRCYFVDLRRVPVAVGWDGMHPVEASYHDIAREIWGQVLKHNVSALVG